MNKFQDGTVLFGLILGLCALFFFIGGVVGYDSGKKDLTNKLCNKENYNFCVEVPKDFEIPNVD